MRHRQQAEPFTFGELEFETIVTPSGPAWALRLDFDAAAPLPDGPELWLWLRQDGDLLQPAHDRWADEEGDLCVPAALEEGEEGRLHFVATLPFVALPSPCPREVELFGTLGDGEEVLAESAWDLKLPSRAERELGHLLGAFVAATAEVLGELSELQARRLEEVLCEAWTLDEHGREMLRRALARVRAGKADPELWEEAFAELDEDEQAHLAEVILEVAEAGGGLTGEQDDAAEALFESFELDVEIWRECRDDVPEEEEETETEAPPSLQASFTLLELEATAGWDEVRAAYRRLAADYHPDKVAHLPKGFQEFATGRMQQLNTAYQQLKAHFGR